jgi:hypothetical protein
MINLLDHLLFQGQYPPLYDRDLDPLDWYGDYIRLVALSRDPCPGRVSASAFFSCEDKINTPDYGDGQATSGTDVHRASSFVNHASSARIAQRFSVLNNARRQDGISA